MAERSTALVGSDTLIENRTFDEIALGDSATLERTLSRQDIELFAVMSGDVNPAHLDEEYARDEMFHRVIGHGMWGAALISTVLGTTLPGPGTIYLEQTLRFRRPLGVGDTASVSVTATEKDPERHRVTFECCCTNQRGEVAISGTAVVIAPTEKVRRPRVALPEVQLHKHGVFFRDLISRAEGLEPIRTAVVDPIDEESLGGALAAAEAGLIVPVLVGPEARIRAAADSAGLDISDHALADAEGSRAAAVAAVGMARMGAVQAVMNGSLHPLELVSAAVASASHLRSDRRMSHVVVMDVPAYSRPLFVTDSALNVEPALEDKRDIVQNAIDLAHAMGIDEPKVAVLSATGTVNPKVRSTLDAAALTKMAERGQI
ncbi:MAG: bifunctional enoyl-CoA hydratase/phosphate acetyltransferase, partial [Nocardioidaceae bacterium]